MPEDGLSITKKFDTYYTESYYAWDAFYPLADRDLRFFLGDQWDEQEKRKLFQDGRSTFVFNRIRPVINFLTGYQRQHRKSSVILPVEDKDQLVADQLTQVVMHVMNNGSGYRIISDCFSGAVKTGWNLLSVYMDYSDDPVNGDIRFAREPYSGFICDPYFTQLDFSDCSNVLRRKYLGVEKVASMLPGMEKEVYDLHRIGWSRDDKFTWLPYQRQPDGQELLAYNEMHELKWRDAYIIIDQETGNYRKWPGVLEQLREYVSVFSEYRIGKTQEQYIEMNIIVNDQWVKTVENPYGLDEYAFVPFISIFEPESDQWGLKVQSVTRQLIDPQREANRRRSQMVDILDSQINSGWIANENSVINPRSLFQSSQGRVIWKREDAPPDALTKIPPAQIPPSMFQLQEMFDKDIKDIAGINDAAFGQLESAGESGVMQLIRQGAAIANIQEIMDNLRYAQQYLTKKVVKLIQTWTPQKISRIINQPVSPEFFDPDLSKYDISVQEGMLTDTQRQMYFRQLVDLKQLGAPVTGEMLAKAAPIQGKTEFNQEIAKMEQQQDQQAQQQAQIQAQLMQSQQNMAQAKALSDVALSKERYTRAVANMGLEDERASKSIQDRSDAALSRVKAIKELESIDDDRLIKYLGIVRMMEEMNRQKEQQVKSDDVNISAQANQPQQVNPSMMEEQITTEAAYG